MAGAFATPADIAASGGPQLQDELRAPHRFPKDAAPLATTPDVMRAGDQGAAAYPQQAAPERRGAPVAAAAALSDTAAKPAMPQIAQVLPVTAALASGTGTAVVDNDDYDYEDEVLGSAPGVIPGLSHGSPGTSSSPAAGVAPPPAGPPLPTDHTQPLQPHGAALLAAVEAAADAAACALPASQGPALSGLDAVLGDHERIRVLFESYEALLRDGAEVTAAALTAQDAKAAEERISREKARVARAMVAALSRHASAEERSLYGVARVRLPYGREMYDKSLMDDQVAKELLQYLLDHVPRTAAGGSTEPLESTVEAWRLYDKAVLSLVEHERSHMGMEEDMIIAPLRALLSPDEQLRLSQDWHTAHSNAPLRPHPRGPTNSLPAALGHPLAGAMDRAGEAAAGWVRWALGGRWAGWLLGRYGAAVM